MSYRPNEESLGDYLQRLEDRIRELEMGNKISARSWSISENASGNLVFTSINGRIVTINATGSNTTI